MSRNDGAGPSHEMQMTGANNEEYSANLAGSHDNRGDYENITLDLSIPTIGEIKSTLEKACEALNIEGIQSDSLKDAAKNVREKTSTRTPLEKKDVSDFFSILHQHMKERDDFRGEKGADLSAYLNPEGLLCEYAVDKIKEYNEGNSFAKEFYPSLVTTLSTIADMADSPDRSKILSQMILDSDQLLCIQGASDYLNDIKDRIVGENPQEREILKVRRRLKDIDRGTATRPGYAHGEGISAEQIREEMVEKRDVLDKIHEVVHNASYIDDTQKVKAFVVLLQKQGVFSDIETGRFSFSTIDAEDLNQCVMAQYAHHAPKPYVTFSGIPESITQDTIDRFTATPPSEPDGRVTPDLLSAFIIDQAKSPYINDISMTEEVVSDFLMYQSARYEYTSSFMKELGWSDEKECLDPQQLQTAIQADLNGDVPTLQESPELPEYMKYRLPTTLLHDAAKATFDTFSEPCDDVVQCAKVLFTVPKITRNMAIAHAALVGTVTALACTANDIVGGTVEGGLKMGAALAGNLVAIGNTRQYALDPLNSSNKVGEVVAWNLAAIGTGSCMLVRNGMRSFSAEGKENASFENIELGASMIAVPVLLTSSALNIYSNMKDTVSDVEYRQNTARTLIKLPIVGACLGASMGAFDEDFDSSIAGIGAAAGVIAALVPPTIAIVADAGKNAWNHANEWLQRREEQQQPEMNQDVRIQM